MKFGVIILSSVGILCVAGIAYQLGTLSSNVEHQKNSLQNDRSRDKLPDFSTLLNNRNPITFQRDYLYYLDQLTAENAEESAKILWQTAGELEEIKDRQKLFAYAWGALDGEAAVNFIFSHKSVAKVSALSQAFAGWASKDPEAAKAWVESHLKPSEQLLYRWALVDGWARHDPETVSDYVMSLKGLPGRGCFMRSIALERVRKNPEDAVTWQQSLPEGELREAALNETTLQWSRADPNAASVWASTLTNPTEAGNAFDIAITEWTRRDTIEPAQFLETMSPGDVRDRGLAAYVDVLAYQDLNLITPWAQMISNAELREATLLKIARDAIQRDPEGTKKWLPNSGLGEGAIHKL